MKVGDYVRTKKGIMGKIINISKNRVGTTTYLVEWSSCKAYYVSQVKDYKSSSNIIDLIKIGDYVNGKRVIDFMLENGKRKGIIVDADIWGFDIDEIKSIVSKEQFESMEYRL